MKSENIIELKNISISFGSQTVLDGIDLSIRDGEFVTLLGPSGCGKTTTLRIIGGFETPDGGDVLFNGKRINDLPAYKRNVNTIFQRYALFPHLNVYENIAFGMRVKKAKDADIKKKVSEMLKLVNLEGLEKRKIDTLSGGQQQRVAIARALIHYPQILFADEPTGSLDKDSSNDVLDLLLSIRAELNQTLIVVTHDLSIAERADRILKMDNGILSVVHRTENK